MLDCYATFARAVAERGRHVAGEALDRPSEGFAVPRGASRRMVTSGPYAETVEHIAGFYLADLPSIEDARELATLLPPQHLVEVRGCPNVGATPR